MLRRGAGRRLARAALLLPVRLQALHLALHHLHLLPQHLRGHQHRSISNRTPQSPHQAEDHCRAIARSMIASLMALTVPRSDRF